MRQWSKLGGHLTDHPWAGTPKNSVRAGAARLLVGKRKCTRPCRELRLCHDPLPQSIYSSFQSRPVAETTKSLLTMTYMRSPGACAVLVVPPGSFRSPWKCGPPANGWVCGGLEASAALRSSRTCSISKKKRSSNQPSASRLPPLDRYRACDSVMGALAPEPCSTSLWMEVRHLRGDHE